MKTAIYFFIFCLTALMAHAGKSYILTVTRGDITISNNSTEPALVPGDTLFIPANGKYTSVQYRHLKGDSTNKIWIIWLPGSEVRLPKSFQQLSNYNMSYVVIQGMRYFNLFATSKFSFGVHDVVFDHCQWINPPGAFKDQPAIQWDDARSPVSMVFTGKKTQTFYNVTYQGCLFDGFQNCSVIEMSSNWNNANNEPRRSIVLDFKFVNDTFQNIIITAPGGLAAIMGTGFNCKVRGCYFKNILGPDPSPASHSASVLWFGSIDISGCKQENSYAQFLRCVPLGWKSIPGYLDKNTACRAWGNIIHNNLGYSGFEFIRNMRNERTEANGVYPIKAICVFNTIFRTRRNNGYSAYYGFVADNLEEDTIDCSYNMIISPECDFPFDATRGYIVANVLGKPKHLTMTGNKVFKSWMPNIVKDTLQFEPGPAALLAAPVKNYSFMDADFYGEPLSAKGKLYAGAVEKKR
ncbi:MAG: hypothetical protein QM726_15365 [Chitinophagaceae bacterium]